MVWAEPSAIVCQPVLDLLYNQTQTNLACVSRLLCQIVVTVFIALGNRPALLLYRRKCIGNIWIKMRAAPFADDGECCFVSECRFVYPLWRSERSPEYDNF